MTTQEEELARRLAHVSVKANFMGYPQEADFEMPHVTRERLREYLLSYAEAIFATLDEMKR